MTYKQLQVILNHLPDALLRTNIVRESCSNIPISNLGIGEDSVDIGIYPLVEELKELDVKVYASCQGGPVRDELGNPSTASPIEGSTYLSNGILYEYAYVIIDKAKFSRLKEFLPITPKIIQGTNQYYIDTPETTDEENELTKLYVYWESPIK